MGTKIQANTFLGQYHTVIDLDGSPNSGTRSLYHENLKSDENPDGSFKLYDQEKVRRTILEHESIFRNQLQELHRLYGRQCELMNEIKMNKDGGKEEDKCRLFSRNLLEDARKPRDPFHSSSSRSMAGCVPISGTRFPKLPVFQNHQISQHKADTLTFDFQRKDNAGDISTNSCSNSNLVTKDFFPCSADRMYGERSSSILGLMNERRGKEQLSNDYAEKRRFDKLSSGKPLEFPQSLLAEPKKEFSNCPIASVSRKRKKNFGVEICEENDDPINVHMSNQKDENHRVFSSSWIDNFFMQSLHLRGTNPNERSKADMSISSKERFSNHSDMQGNRVDKVGYQNNTCDPNSYFKNVDNMNQVSEKVQGGLPWFLRNSQVGDDQSKGSYFMNLDSLQNSSQKFFGKAETPDDTFQTSNQNTNEVTDGASGKKIPISDVLQGSSIGGTPNLRHCIDLNLSLDEEDEPSVPYLPAAVVKIAITEIDLEASIVIKSEKVASRESKNLDFECDKIAAEAMMAISSLSPESTSVDSLKWFAEIVSGEYSNVVVEKEESIPDSMDYFEYMTLKLEDTKKENYHYEPLVFGDDETEATQTKRSRRRGGRQRKDFQRDILPGMVTLSRLQVTEDFQAFDELLKAGGLSRNGRGRRRQATSPMVKKLCSTEAHQPICQLEERRSLAGWGKRTRRLPRQRCSNAFVSFVSREMLRPSSCLCSNRMPICVNRYRV